MLGSHVDELQAFVTKASEWRTLGLTVNLKLFQLNCEFPDGTAVTLFWDPEAIDNGDGTFTGDWRVVTS